MSHRSCAGLLLGVLALGCVPPYKPPSAAEPHAVLKLRRSYDTFAGVNLRERVEIDEHYALRQTSPAPVAQTPRADAVLAHPRPQTFVFGSEFYHNELRSVYESYQDCRTVFEMESYDCSSGSGTNKSYRTCSRSVPRQRCTTKWHYVTKNVEVSDGACETGLRFAPQEARVYLLQYTYSAPGVCTLSCFEQFGNPDGTFQNKGCPAAPPEK